MPKELSAKFRRDDVAAARRGTIPVPEVAVDFGVAENTARRSLHKADIDDGVRDGPTTTGPQEIVRLRRANRCLGVENEILCSAAARLAKHPLPV